MIRTETTLDAILKKGHLLFLDTSAGKGLKHHGVYSWYADGIYDAKKFEQVDLTSLINGLEELQILRQIALEKTTLVTREVLAEINKLTEIMQKHFEYLQRQRQYRTKKASEYEVGELNRERQIYDAFNTCVLDLFSIQKRLERKVFQGQHEEQTYLKFLKAAKTAASIPEVKRDLSYRYPQETYKRETAQTETDEIVVGNALYMLSLPEQNVVGIITGDSHIERIRNATFGIIKNDPHFRDLGLLLSGKRLPVYFSLGREKYAVS